METLHKTIIATNILRIPLLRNVLVASMLIAFVFPIYSILLVNPSFIQLLIESIEEDARLTVTHLASSMTPEKRQLTKDSLSDDLIIEIEKLKRDFELEKLKIYSKSGEVIYSTNPKDIGDRNTGEYFHEIVAKGKVHTKVVQKDSASSEGRILRYDAVEIYAPIMSGGTFAGAAEIYYDITHQKQDLENLLSHSSSITFAIALTLLIAVVAILYKASKSIIDHSRAEESLRNTKDSMVSIFNGITAGIAYISSDYRIIHANQAYKALLNGNSDAGTLKKVRCFEDFWQRHEPCRNCPGRSAIRIGKSQEVEREIVLRNNDRRVIRIHAYPVPATSGNPGGFVEYVMDVTQQKRLEAELRSYTEHLEELTEERAQKLKQAQVQIAHQEKMAALGQMAAGVAHEIGNPLSALSSLVRAMEADLRKNRPDGKKVKSMKEQVDRISKIVRQMMDFSRPASHLTTLTNGNQVIQSALGISSYDRRLKKVNVITRLDNEIPGLKVDEDQLLQVFLNIIFNAADAMNGQGTLTVGSRLENNSVIFVFEDTGPGIPEHLVSRIFEPFFTTKDVGEGTGLGLSVSYGIMQSMGGLIKAANREDGGSVFTVRIPLEAPGEGDG